MRRRLKVFIVLGVDNIAVISLAITHITPSSNTADTRKESYSGSKAAF